ncbi:MAG: 5'/3'-nucleotidase SurE [Bacteroidales bacterium]|jgi:5'-nucleotidase|nr:5'/3'-nucleotidase SurE [Bacteroidales bacterium]MCI2121134.1 5'/3'-nucleotidase SurE [Bacteroidales bacterium]MCI2144724.1 5'/3'-nucleotidase SurE [Bacteroidales bacterium]
MVEKKILVTNDDGIEAKGINVIAEFMRRWGNVTVVAPAKPQSAKSASVTLNKEIALTDCGSSREENGKGAISKYSFGGTPVDCVKVTMNHLFSLDSMPDLLISGINHGSNASTASLYSGTLGACAEATAYGIPSIGLSLNTCDSDPDFSSLLHFVPWIMESYVAHPFRKGVYLNINFPYLPIEKIKGIRMGHQGAGQWIHEFDMTREDREKGTVYFRMTGSFVNHDGYDSADHLLISGGYVSIVPHLLDTTDYAESERLGRLWKPEMMK